MMVTLCILLVGLCILLGGARMLYCGHKARPDRRAVPERRAAERSVDRRGRA